MILSTQNQPILTKNFKSLDAYKYFVAGWVKQVLVWQESILCLEREMTEKITEKLLLEKGSPKTKRLEDIKTLKLSKLGLKCSDLPVKLLSRLQSLERCDLSGNRLQEFPKNLELPKLRFLDLSDNQMEDVTSMASLCSLEEVMMEDNLYITVSDNYKLMTLLPNLRSYNGKDITSTANHVRFVFTENLRTRIVALWEKSYSLPVPVTSNKMAVLEEDFVNAVRKQVKYGPNSVSDFTKWKVEIMAREYLRSLTEEDSSNEEVSTTIKRKETPLSTYSDVRLIPRKKSRSDPEDAVIPATRRQCSLVPRRVPAKKEAVSGCLTTPVNRVKSGPKNESNDDLIKSINKTQPVRLQPLHVLQCHSKQDNSEDFSTQLWACAFQPQQDSSGSRIVATCGGDSLCLIDCETGMVMKKYKVTGEEFFSLAWSTVLMSRGGGASAQPCNILAAGGKRGLVKLIHPRCNVAYGEFRVSRRALSILRFNHRQGNFLFTGSYDNKIVLWDIGGIDSTYNFKVVQLLTLESSSTPLHICLPPTKPDAQLLAACEDGLHWYNTQLAPKGGTKRSIEAEVTFPVYKNEDKDLNYHTVDGLAFLTDDIVASKNFSYSCIYLWSWSQTRSQRRDKNGHVRAAVLAELRWANTEIPYLALSTCPGRSYIVCGDNEGKLWTYHITKLQTDNFQTGKPIEPTEVLQWPAPVRQGLGPLEGPSINSVAIDPEFQYLVALSDKNMVMVWKRTP
ncbi:leucine-rich repeat and WD repeat-containing protein 1 isoform X2 [Corythoichthys intestinalis]|uniref:leucine-rich repeat and WD repeat-containing protein 1 isoform X2 n=1 Tax=Corythoichthys intestinalis TaxID=161448 RepID=UPI0025A5F2A3|nr:leucine-rich repeat and WD repeat-containing protein 1 isoform X2 [Corythoichthys intestinalis]